MMKLSFPLRAFRYFRDPLVSRWRKLIGLVAVAYVVFPFDAIPDFIPLIGWLDDLGVISAVAYFMVREINAHQKAANALIDVGDLGDVGAPDGLPRSDDGTTRGKVRI
ncbi:MAG: YkvA family protein [Myxococcaceae bacterium]